MKGAGMLPDVMPWVEQLKERWREREPAPPGIVRDTDTGELHVDGGYWADGGFSVELFQAGDYRALYIASDQYEETAIIPVEKIPLLLNAIRLVMELDERSGDGCESGDVSPVR